MDEQLKPCPFCGHKVDINDPDVIHPTGIYWFRDPKSDISMFGEDVGFLYDTDEVSDNAYWIINCVESSGGCDTTIHGISKEDVIKKWQRRTS